jgi:hypothetical protein
MYRMGQLNQKADYIWAEMRSTTAKPWAMLACWASRNTAHLTARAVRHLLPSPQPRIKLAVSDQLVSLRVRPPCVARDSGGSGACRHVKRALWLWGYSFRICHSCRLFPLRAARDHTTETHSPRNKDGGDEEGRRGGRRTSSVRNPRVLPTWGGLPLAGSDQTPKHTGMWQYGFSSISFHFMPSPLQMLRFIATQSGSNC